MTYSVVAVASVTDIPAAISTFAVARGWSSSGAGVITNPVTGRTYTITADSGTNTVTIAASGTGITAGTKMPYLGTVTPVALTPTQLHLFGNNAAYVSPDTEPFIACVIECGFNHYRHLYMGGIVKAGAFTDGDLFSSNNFSEYFTSVSSVDINSSKHRTLFRGYCNAARAGGGALITHADNATPWRDFAGPIDSFPGFEEFMDGTEIYGGNMDGVNDGRVFRGHINFGSAQLLVPVSLYVSKGNDGADYRFVPVGHASGVRLVDMKDLTPGQQCLIASTAWRVFPEFSKASGRTATKSSSGAWWQSETSQYLGLAYRE